MDTSDVGLASVKKTTSTADARFITLFESATTTSDAENITYMMPLNTTSPFQNTHDEASPWLMNLYLVMTAFIITFGILGNSLTIIVMRTEPFNSSSYGIHLTALAVADNLVLILYTFTKESTMYLFERDVFGESDIICKIFLHSLISVKLFTSFNIGFICIERFIAIWFPFQSRILLSKRAAIIANSCMLASANIGGISQFLVGFVKSGKCLAFQETARATPLPQVILFILAIVPTIILLTFTPLIIFKLIRQQLRRRRMRNDTESGNGQLTFMTAMLVGTVTAYILLVSFPTIVRFLLVYIGITPAMSRKTGIHDFIVTADHLNSSINFVIYGLLCSQFRNQLKDICRRSCKMRT